MNNESGLTLVEVLVTTFVSLIFMTIIMKSFDNITQLYTKGKIKASADRQIENIKNRIRINGDTSAGTSFDNYQVLGEDYTVYPYFWSEKINLMTEKECEDHFQSTSCPLQGRLNYLMVPTGVGHNLFVAKIAIYHPLLNSGQIKKSTFYLTLGQ
jgi:hypothetical protein